MLRQQQRKSASGDDARPYVCLADYVAPRDSGLVDHVGGFAVTVVWTAGTLARTPWALAVHPIVPGLATAAILIVGLTPFTTAAPAHAVDRYFPAEGPRERAGQL